MELIKLQEHLYVPTDFGKHHHYYADPEGTKEYTGITSILGVLAKPALIGWAARMAVEYIRENCEWTQKEPDKRTYTVLDEELELAKGAHARKKDDAAVHGTDAHALVEAYINDCIAINDGQPRFDFVKTEINPFMEWARENVDHFLFSERRMAHPELFVAGTADFAAVMKDGKKLMGDFKTSSGIYGIDYWLQVSAYRLLAEYEGDEPYDGSVIVRLGKKGPQDFEVQYLYDYETFRDAFLACLTIYRAQAAIKGLTVH